MCHERFLISLNGHHMLHATVPNDTPKKYVSEEYPPCLFLSCKQHQNRWTLGPQYTKETCTKMHFKPSLGNSITLGQAP